MTNQEKIREEIRVVLNRILDEEYESVLKILRDYDTMDTKIIDNKSEISIDENK